jgi:hypothetical protein
MALSEKEKARKRDRWKRRYLSDPEFREKCRLNNLKWRQSSPQYKIWLAKNMHKVLMQNYKYKKSAKGRAAVRRYRQGAHFQAWQREYMRKYRKTEKYQAYLRQYELELKQIRAGL